MVPDSYHAFYSGCVSVAGALIGLLFVAISVAPHKLAGERASIGFQVKASVAFAALINALVVALVALLPGANFATTLVIVSISGTGSTIGLAILGLRGSDARGHRAGMMIRFAALLGVFVAQFANALPLVSSSHDPRPVSTEAILLIACFLVAIDRAWELVGGTGKGMLSLFARLIREHNTITGTDTAADPPTTDTTATVATSPDATDPLNFTVK